MSHFYRVQLYAFALPLVRPIPVGHQTIASREGILLSLEDQHGCLGLGEVMPLPGMHKETLEEAKLEIQTLVPSLLDMKLGSDVFQSLEQLDSLYQNHSTSPSVRFGFDMAMMFYHSSFQMELLHKLLEPQSDSVVNVQALLSGEPEELIQQALTRHGEGYRTFKVKLGRSSLQEDIDLVHILRERLGPDVVLRLDPNRAWSLKDAIQFVQQTRSVHWEFLEEPLRVAKEIPALVDETQASIALDESLGWGTDEEPLQPNSRDARLDKASALVLKPHILGGWKTTQAWITWALAHQKKVVFSDCFGSGLGVGFLAHWASSLKQGGAQGLDTGRWLEQDLIPPVIQSGSVEMESSYEVLAQIHPEILRPLNAE